MRQQEHALLLKAYIVVYL